MNNNQNNNIDELLKTHGKRTQINELIVKRAKRNVYAHWQKSLLKKQKQRQHKLKYVFAMAAVLVLMVTFALFYRLNTSVAPFSHSLYSQGELLVSNDGENWSVNTENVLQQNTWIKTTNNSFANITLADKSQLRINQNSQLHLLNSTEIVLLKGEIYHDADMIHHSIPLLIKTHLGDIQHIGTRYLINLTNKELNVAVRNGLVKINQNNNLQQITAGKQLTVDLSGNQSTTVISAYDRKWHWTQSAAKPFEFEGHSLNEFILWYAHENGYTITWNQNETQTKRVKLSANLQNLEQNQQIKTVFLATKFDYEINKGILSIL